MIQVNVHNVLAQVYSKCFLIPINGQKDHQVSRHSRVLEELVGLDQV